MADFGGDLDQLVQVGPGQWAPWSALGASGAGMSGGVEGMNGGGIGGHPEWYGRVSPGGGYPGYLGGQQGGAGPGMGQGGGNLGGKPFEPMPGSTFDPGQSVGGFPSNWNNMPWGGSGYPGGGMPGGGRGMLPGGGVPGAGAQQAANAPLAAALGQLGNQYASQYADSLARNQKLYNDVLAGYQGTGRRQVGWQNQIAQGYQQAATNTLGYLQPMRDALGQQQQWQQGIRQGYGDLTKQTLGDIQGIDASQRQQIQDAYAAQMGSNRQNMISRGLGNSTVQDSLDRGALADKSKADIALSNQMAGLTAGYRSQLGLAGLGYENQASQQNTGQQNAIANAYAGYNTQWGLPGLNYLNQAVQQNTGLDLSQYGFMAGTQIGYPNAQQYQQVAGQLGSFYGRGVY